MSEPKDLIEQLKRSNRGWKAVALAVCFVQLLAAIGKLCRRIQGLGQAEAALREVHAALGSAKGLESPAAEVMAMTSFLLGNVAESQPLALAPRETA